MEEPDPAVVRAASAGDLDAFEQIVRAYQQQVWRFLRRMLGDDGLAEDVAQETFLRLFRRLSTFSFQSKLSTWVFQIARNAALDELRRRQRRDRTLTRLRRRPAVASPPDVPAEIGAALASLPPPLREALVVIEVLGLRYREAAAVLDIPEGTVKRRVFDARVRLHRWSAADTEADPTTGTDAGDSTAGSPRAPTTSPGTTPGSPGTTPGSPGTTPGSPGTTP
ncbi:MAG: RNA polymerase sigma factor, partial [Acidimicrobiia bacterium]